MIQVLPSPEDFSWAGSLIRILRTMLKRVNLLSSWVLPSQARLEIKVLKCSVKVCSLTYWTAKAQEILLDWEKNLHKQSAGIKSLAWYLGVFTAADTVTVHAMLRKTGDETAVASVSSMRGAWKVGTKVTQGTQFLPPFLSLGHDTNGFQRNQRSKLILRGSKTYKPPVNESYGCIWENTCRAFITW